MKKNSADLVCTKEELSVADILWQMNSFHELFRRFGIAADNIYFEVGGGYVSVFAVQKTTKRIGMKIGMKVVICPFNGDDEDLMARWRVFATEMNAGVISDAEFFEHWKVSLAAKYAEGIYRSMISGGMVIKFDLLQEPHNIVKDPPTGWGTA